MTTFGNDFRYLVGFPLHAVVSPFLHLKINNIFLCYNCMVAFPDNSTSYSHGVILHLDLPVFLRKFRVVFVKFISER